jgi:hypothetical protein
MDHKRERESRRAGGRRGRPAGLEAPAWSAKGAGGAEKEGQEGYGPRGRSEDWVMPITPI